MRDADAVAGNERAMSQPTLTPAAFAARWRGVATTEKAASQVRLLDMTSAVGAAGANCATSQ